jgi:hypothetical protein
VKSLRPLVVLAGIIGGTLACGDSSGPGPQAASVTGIAGDNQQAGRGTSLPFPLSFTALGSNGQPIQGVSVSWSVTPTGGAVFSAPTSQTDVNGVGTTNVTLGSTLGAITIRATVSGVAPIVYHATVLDPCTVLTPYSLGQTVNGTLTTTDCLLQLGQNGWYYDFYDFTLPSGQQSVRIKMRGSGSFDDTYVDLYADSGALVALDDDSILGQAGARNSQLDIILPGGAYVIGANSYDPFTTGAYSLASETRPAAMNGCRQVWVTRGVTVSDSITNSDCADSSATPRRYDVARIVVLGGTVLTISQRSTTINPSLALYRITLDPLTRTLVASNDDSLPGSNTNAFVQYNVTASNFYDIIIGTSAAGETGAYTFDVSASTTFSPHTSSPVGRGGGRWWRGVSLPKRSTH